MKSQQNITEIAMLQPVGCDISIVVWTKISTKI